MKIEPIRSAGCFIDNALKFIDNRFFIYMTKDGDSISNVKNIDEITGLLITYNYDDVDKLYWDFYLSILCGDTYYYSESENSYKIQTLDYELTGSISKVSIDDKLVSVFFKITDYKPIFQNGEKLFSDMQKALQNMFKNLFMLQNNKASLRIKAIAVLLQILQ